MIPRSTCLLHVQVQVIHRDCTDITGASCVCGVAMREDDTILIVDMCPANGSDFGNVRYFTYSHDLPPDAGITVSESGRSFKANK